MSEFVFEPRSIEDTHVLTTVIRKAVHEDTTIAEKIMPLTSVNSRRVKVKTVEFNPASLGQFKAINSNTPIRTGGGKVTTEYGELVDLEEKEVLSAEDMLDLYSLDQRVALGAARTIVEVTRELQQRNRQLSNWMRWKAMQDALVITYPDGSAISVDYDMNNTDAKMKYNHIKDVSGSAPWNNVGSDIITTVQGWIDEIKKDAGAKGSILIFNTNTWRKVQLNTALLAKISSSFNRIITPSMVDTATIFWDEPNSGQIMLEDAYYEDTAGAQYDFVPDGYALLTSPWTVDGEQIGKLWDGPVVRVNGTDLTISNNPGAEAEIYVNAEQKSKNVRVGTARMPWLRRQCFIWARVY